MMDQRWPWAPGNAGQADRVAFFTTACAAWLAAGQLPTAGGRHRGHGRWTTGDHP